MKIAILFLFVVMSSWSHAHEFFFAFAEVQYDEVSGRTEVSISLTTHDFERILKEKHIIEKEINTYASDSIQMGRISNEILKHFKIKSSTSNGEMNLKFEGFETELTGIVHFYYSAVSSENFQRLEFTFDLLMDDYPEQQNKITFLFRDKKRTMTFLPAERTQMIQL